MRNWALLFIVMWSFSAHAVDDLEEKGEPAPAPQVTAKKTGKEESQLNWYATVEFRHHINTYYDADDYLGKREPSGHARLQVGTTLYDGLLDAYGTVGVFKIPRTQQVFQRRPQLALDVYPFRHEHFTLLQYNLVQLPFNEAEQDPELDPTERTAGTIYTVGIAPSARWSFPIGSSRLTLKGGLDGWTKMYSRAQTTANYRDEENESRLELAGDEVDVEAVNAAPSEIEDYAQHYFTQAVVGVAWHRILGGDVETSMTANYRTDYEPFYEIDAQSSDYRYKADRYSFYKWRLKFQLTERISFVNDFYHFHDGLFAAKRRGEDDRRFRNIARIQCKL